MPNFMESMFIAIETGNLEDFKRLLGNDKNTWEMNTPFGPWLHLAATYGQLGIVKFLVKKGADVNVLGGSSGGNALNAAASDGHLEIVKYLFEKGSQLDVSDPVRNPLFSAIVSGHTDIAKFLIDSGIDASVKYSSKRDALAIAREWGRTDIVNYIQAKLKLDPTPAPKRGNRKKAKLETDVLRTKIAEATRQAFDQIRAAHGREKIYAFALCTVDDAVVITPSANTVKAYENKQIQSRADSNRTKADRLGNDKWSPFEWAYEHDGADFFESVNEMINHRGQGAYDPKDPNGFINFKAGVMSSMVRALLILDSEGYFGRGAARESLTVFCSLPSSECTTWFEHDSAERLNPTKLFKQFHRERIKYIAEPDETFPPDDDLYSAYLTQIEDAL